MAENYIDNKNFHALILEYKKRKKSNPKERIPEEIGRMLLLMAERLGTRYSFNQYTYKDEMISDAILRVISVFDNYDPEKFDKPFAYFNAIIWRSFLQRIKKEKKERVKMEKLIMVDDIFLLHEMDDSTLVSKDDMINGFVFNSYEDME